MDVVIVTLFFFGFVAIAANAHTFGDIERVHFVTEFALLTDSDVFAFLTFFVQTRRQQVTQLCGLIELVSGLVAGSALRSAIVHTCEAAIGQLTAVQANVFRDEEIVLTHIAHTATFAHHARRNRFVAKSARFLCVEEKCQFAFAALRARNTDCAVVDGHRTQLAIVLGGVEEETLVTLSADCGTGAGGTVSHRFIAGHTLVARTVKVETDFALSADCGTGASEAVIHGLGTLGSHSFVVLVVTLHGNTFRSLDLSMVFGLRATRTCVCVIARQTRLLALFAIVAFEGAFHEHSFGALNITLLFVKVGVILGAPFGCHCQIREHEHFERVTAAHGGGFPEVGGEGESVHVGDPEPLQSHHQSRVPGGSQLERYTLAVCGSDDTVNHIVLGGGIDRWEIEDNN